MSVDPGSRGWNEHRHRHLVDDVTLTDVQTLTNKTLTSPTLTNPTITGTITGGPTLTAPHLTSPVVDSGGLTVTAGILTIPTGSGAASPLVYALAAAARTDAFSFGGNGSLANAQASIWQAQRNYDNVPVLQLTGAGVLTLPSSLVATGAPVAAGSGAIAYGGSLGQGNGAAATLPLLKGTGFGPTSTGTGWIQLNTAGVMIYVPYWT